MRTLQRGRASDAEFAALGLDGFVIVFFRRRSDGPIAGRCGSFRSRGGGSRLVTFFAHDGRKMDAIRDLGAMKAASADRGKEA